jgi:hypothetical protein
MTKFKTTDLVGRIRVLDDVELTAVSGGAFELPENLRLAATPVGGWDMKDVFARPVLGTYQSQ